MPCNCDHMEPSQHEVESRKLMELMAEVGLHKDDVPYYGNVSAIHEHTAMMCKFCQDNDVTKYSLELQIWWRDHQIADMERLERELNEKKKESAKREAIAKLTPYERELLGIKVK